VFYEMVTGQRAFEGEDVSETLAFVLTKEPDWSRLAPAVPNRLRRVLQGMLEKDARRRVSDIAVVTWELEESQPAGSESPMPPAASAARRWTSSLPWGFAAAAGMAAAVLATHSPAPMP
jgi:serine/threonine-protein kinase